MGNRETTVKEQVIRKVLKGNMSKKKAASLLGRSARTIYRYLGKFMQNGIPGLEDKRGGNNSKVTPRIEREIVVCKLQGKHRSARFIKDHLKLKLHRRTVWRIL